MNEESQTTGWDAIDAALKQHYGEQEPKHYGAMISYMLGGPDPLDGISVYKVEEPVKHWHYVTYGISELFEKEQENQMISGYGFELSFRLVIDNDEEEPPAWALNLLQKLARYVFNSGNVFQSGDYMDANGPICLESETELTALAFIKDPDLTSIETPNGTVEFIQVVGITEDELAAMQAWNTKGLLHAFESDIPKYLTNLSRNSLLLNERIYEKFIDGKNKEGSNTAFLFVDQLHYEKGVAKLFRKKQAVVQLGAKQAEVIRHVLEGRAVKQEPLMLSGNDLRVIFSFGSVAAVVEEEAITITLSPDALTELCSQLECREKEFTIKALPDLRFIIAKTEITNQEGDVVKVIG